MQRVVIRVSQDAMKVVRAAAKHMDSDLGLAADALIMGAPNGGSKLIGADLMKEIKKLVGSTGTTVPVAIERLLKMGLSRHNALKKYAKKKD